MLLPPLLDPPTSLFSSPPLTTQAPTQVPAGDLTLNAALARAREARPLLQAAERRVAAARRARSAAGSPLSPTLFLGATGKGDPTGGSEDLALVVPLDVFGRVRAARSTGDAALALAEAELRSAQAQVQGEVLLRYADASAAEALVVIARTQSEIAGRLLDATRRRSEEGAVPGVQVQRAQIEADRSARTLIRREAESRAARVRLAGALGVGGEVAVRADAFPDLGAALPGVIVPETPEILARAAEASGASADVRVARLLGRPELQFEVRRAPFYDSDNRLYPRLQLSLPLLNGRRDRDERGAAEERKRAAERSLADARIQAKAALAAARLEYAGAGGEVASYATTLAAARTLVERSEIGLREGAVTFTETLEAVRGLRDVQEELAEARRRLANATAELLRAGGIVLPALSAPVSGSSKEVGR